MQRLMLVVLSAITLALTGCTGGEEKTDTAADTARDIGTDATSDTVTDTTDDTAAADDTGLTGTTPPECADVAADQCAAYGCASIEGFPLISDGAGGLCVDWSSPTAHDCMDADMGCDDAVAVATSPDDPDTLWFFTNLCLPDGWILEASADYPACK